MKNIISAVCTVCGKEYEATDDTLNCKSCGGILDIIYDYKYIKPRLTREKLKVSRDNSMFRYIDLLPIKEGSKLTPLRVGLSPLYKAPKLAEAIGVDNLYIKDDGLNPTSSLKDRASAIAVIRAANSGCDTVACSSTGNAASSLAGGAAAMGLKSFIFVPDRAPKGKVAQLMIFGANVITVKGSYEDTFKLSAEAIKKYGWYNRNAAINPYLSEGKKTVALEIIEQMNYSCPDYVAISVGDGCTIAGAWKGFKDLYALGLIEKLPRMISVQASGCNPINKAFENKTELEPMEENTIADSIAVGVPRNGVKALKCLEESNGITVNVTDEEILQAMSLIGRTTGVFGEPAGVTATAGIKKAVESNLIPRGAVVVSVVTGNGLKDVVSAQKAVVEPMNIEPNLKVMQEEFKKLKIKL